MSDLNSTTSTITCTACPYSRRCVQGQCVVGATGSGCATCDIACRQDGCAAERYFQVNESCFPCPEGLATTVIVVLLVVAVLFLRTLWYITMVRTMEQDGDEGLEARQQEFDELDEAKSNASMLQTATQVRQA